MQKVYIDEKYFLNVQVEGNTNFPKIIFSNSLGSDLRLWDSQVQTLKDKFCIIRYDTRGHGQSSKFVPPFSFNMLGNDVINILNELEIEKAHFIGLSIGGMTSLGLALKHQNRFDKIVCCAARADMPAPMKESWNERISIVQKMGTDEVVNSSLERWYSEKFRNNPNNMIKINLATEMIKNTSIEGYIGCCEAIKNLNYLKELSTINKEILYLSGENDIGAPAMAMEEMHHLTPNSKYECIPDAAHIINIEAPDLVNKIILNFLN